MRFVGRCRTNQTHGIKCECSHRTCCGALRCTASCSTSRRFCRTSQDAAPQRTAFGVNDPLYSPYGQSRSSVVRRRVEQRHRRRAERALRVAAGVQPRRATGRRPGPCPGGQSVTADRRLVADEPCARPTSRRTRSERVRRLVQRRRRRVEPRPTAWKSRI